MAKIYIGASKGVSLLSKVIRIWQGGAPYTHTFYVKDLNTMAVIEAWNPNGVTYDLLKNTHTPGTEYVVFEIEVTDEQKEKIEEFLHSRIGYPYDLMSVLLFPFRFKVKNKKAYFCTELLMDAFEFAGINSYLDSNFVTENILTPQTFLLSPNKKKVKEGTV